MQPDDPGMIHAPHEPTSEPGTPDFFLEVAGRIGARIAAAAIPVEEGLTWRVMSPDRSVPGSREAVPARADAMVYEGTAGIVIFLAELYGATGNAELLPAIEGGMSHALHGGGELSAAAFGFHSGRVGIAYAAARAGHIMGVPDWTRAAERVLAPAAGHESEDAGLDVIAGAAGAIPALLRMAEWGVDAELTGAMARALGDHLIAVAERETVGWAWATMRGTSVRYLNGYAHGAAGCAHALAELYHVTGDSRYAYAAEQGFRYERHFMDHERGNWPDLRHVELSEYLTSGRLDELRARIRGGDAMRGSTERFMSAWCHGAPGIGLSRLRAWEILHDPVYRDEARAAVRGSTPMIDDARINFSLCHGRAGNTETLLEAAARLGDPALREHAERVAMNGWEHFERVGKPWLCGTIDGLSDPGLLLGEAGIGYFFLRLARPATPSVLLLTAPGDGVGRRDPELADTLREDWIDRFLGPTLRAWRALGVEILDAARTDPEATFDALEARAGAERDPALRALLQDAFATDLAGWESVRSVTDFTRATLAALVRPGADEIAWSEGRFELAAGTRLVHTAHDWDAWLAQGPSRPAAPEPSDTFHLVTTTGNRATSRTVGSFAGIVLQATEGGATLDEVIGRIVEALGDASPPDRAWLEERVVGQLRQAYGAGFVNAGPAAEA
ncbi:MAG TPA: lanthionine synthetase LanC family protein [Longimicrobium sp.]|nr:lanthionine synthetase LanC family protein [Longimicrobium sp.]